MPEDKYCACCGELYKKKQVIVPSGWLTLLFVIVLIAIVYAYYIQAGSMQYIKSFLVELLLGWVNCLGSFNVFEFFGL